MITLLRRNWKYLVPTVAALVIGLVAGIVIEAQQTASANERASAIRSQLNTTLRELAAAHTQMGNDNAKVVAAQARAQNAVNAADAAAQAKYAGRMASANALLRKLGQEQQVVSQSTISQDGVYVVGRDIPSGTYHTSGGSQCYYATLGSTDTSNIMDNNNFNGPETVDVSGAYAFQISGGCTWTKIG
ncbi:MAG TPA: hypothetical protein VMV92_09975 [Streptosporangiaceae bacterium]|nr:hypothetical protein [Streptosporangiaceae bacterium]